jgi:protein FrlC
MSFRFAYSSNAYTRHSVERAIDETSDAGFDGIEILADVPHVNPLRVTARLVDRLALRLRRRGLAVSNVNANTNLALGRLDPEGFRPSLLEADDSSRQRRVEYIRRAIDFAAAIGSPCVAISVGRSPGGPALELRARLIRGLEEVLARAERRGVNVGIEFEPGHFIESSRQLDPVLRAVGHPRLGANLDIGHARCAGEHIPSVIRRLRGRIWNLHFEDIRGRTHRHLIPGMGDIDFASAFRALERTGYSGFVTLELYPYKARPTWAGRRGLAHLKRTLERGRKRGA